MPTIRQSAKFSAGCRWRVPLGGNASRALATCRGSRAANVERVLSAGSENGGIWRRWFSPVPGITRRRAGRLLTFEEGRPISGRPCRCGKIPLRGQEAAPLSQIRTCPKQGTRPESGLACHALSFDDGSKVSRPPGLDRLRAPASFELSACHVRWTRKCAVYGHL